MPEPVGWYDGPGTMQANQAPWDKVKDRYAFVDELAAARRLVHGAGNIARFEYWLNTYRYMAAVAELGCMRGELDSKAASIEAEKDAAKKKTTAQDALALRIRMARLWERMIGLQLAAVDTPGEMGTLANLEQHSRNKDKFLTAHDELLAGALGTGLPDGVNVCARYAGAARIIVPTVRTQIDKGEKLRLKVIVLDRDLPKAAALYWRPLGQAATAR